MIDIRRFEEVDSTNLEAKRLWKRNPDSSMPVAIMAKSQTDGIGRQGRQWVSPHGGLWISVLYPAKQSLSFYESLPLMVGLVVCNLLEKKIAQLFQIKWPNDVFYEGGKVAGILCQAETIPNNGALIIGLGLNCNNQPDEIPGPLRHRADSLRQIAGEDFELETLAADYLVLLEQALVQFEKNQLEPFQSEIEKRLLWKSQLVTTVNPNTSQALDGRLLGLDENGHLILEIDGQKQHFSSGELESLCRHRSAEL